MRARVLIIDDDDAMRDMLVEFLRQRDWDAAACASAEEGVRRVAGEELDVVVTDLRMPGMTGIDLCHRLTSTRPDVPVIVMTAFGNLENAVAAIRAGAYDFVTKPVQLDMLEIAVRRAAERRQLNEQIRLLAAGHGDAAPFEEMVGESAPMRRLFDQVARVADADATTLITGESGTGKELVARAIHVRSRRAAGPFCALNCSAVPESLLESELFGHVRGAFTDARESRKGLFLQAHGGTLFLDEIGDIPLALQPKLLRVLEERVVRPLGGERELPFDARIVAATNRDLEAAIEERRFREDLFFRLNVIRLEVPPLRARGTDVLLLAQRFVEEIAKRTGKRVTGLSQAAAKKLLAYTWPGNVRELHNAIERAVALTRHDTIIPDDLPERVLRYRQRDIVLGGEDPMELLPMSEIERRYLLHVLDVVQGNKAQASRVLGIDRRTLYRKLEQYGADATAR